MQPLPPLPDQPKQDHLEPLAQYCATLCVIECCGLDACDFSPVHIASYCLSREPRFPLRVANEIIEEAKTLKANFGSNGASARGTAIVEINERMSDQRVDILTATIERQTALAISVLDTMQHEDRDPELIWGKQPNS